MGVWATQDIVGNWSTRVVCRGYCAVKGILKEKREKKHRLKVRTECSGKPDRCKVRRGKVKGDTDRRAKNNPFNKSNARDWGGSQPKGHVGGTEVNTRWVGNFRDHWRGLVEGKSISPNKNQGGL